jgi:membrane associated rhomboid family serine protease
MFPLRDENPSLTTPVVTRALLVLNALVFVYQLSLGPELRRFVVDWAIVPLRFSMALEHGTEPLWAVAPTLVTSMFLHGGWLHLIGNLWYLFIFGDNVEDRLGHARFLFFYLASGLAAAAAHVLADPASRLPTIGASGAVAGVLGAYLVAFPRARVVTLLPLFPIFQVVALPALLVLALWFLFQFASGALALGMGAGAGGVAWWAHVGGFAFGAAVMALFGGRRPRASRAWIEP